MANESSTGVKRPPLLDAVVPLVALAVLIAGALAPFGLDALDGPIQVALLMCCGIAALIAMKIGHSFSTVQEAGRGAVASVTSAIFIPASGSSTSRPKAPNRQRKSHDHVEHPERR